MEDWEKKAGNLKDKVVGEVKDAYGQVTDDKAMEVEGKLQSGAADVKSALDNAADKLNKEGGFIDDIKESISSNKPLAEKAGDVLEDLKEAGAELGEEIREKASDLKEKAEDVFDDVKDRFKK